MLTGRTEEAHTAFHAACPYLQCAALEVEASSFLYLGPRGSAT